MSRGVAGVWEMVRWCNPELVAVWDSSQSWQGIEAVGWGNWRGAVDCIVRSRMVVADVVMELDREGWGLSMKVRAGFNPHFDIRGGTVSC